MSLVHLHLMFNHVPVLGTVFCALLLAFGLFKGSRSVQRASLFGFALIALVSIPVFLTGEPAEHAVSSLPGVSKDLIESHEEMAEVLFVGIELLGVIAALSLLLEERLKKWQGYSRTALLVLSVALGIGAGYVANSGGQIRHSEIRVPSGK